MLRAAPHEGEPVDMPMAVLPKPDDTVSVVGPDSGRRGVNQVRLLRELGLTSQTDLLEVGCGVGRLAYELSDVLTEGTYAGFDVSTSAIDWLHEHYAPHLPNFRFELFDVQSPRFRPEGGQAASAVRFPYDDDAFDMSVSFAVFIHMDIDGITAYLRELARVMRPGSRSVHTFYTVMDGIVGLKRGQHFKEVAPGVWNSKPGGRGGVWGYADELIRSRAEEAGLELVDFRRGTWAAGAPTDGRAHVGGDAYVWTPAAP